MNIDTTQNTIDEINQINGTIAKLDEEIGRLLIELHDLKEKRLQRIQKRNKLLEN